MPEYINPNTYTVHLTGPDGKQVHVRGNQRIILNEYFDKYRSRGFIRLVSESSKIKQPDNKRGSKNVQAKIKLITKKENKSPHIVKVSKKQQASHLPSRKSNPAAERARQKRQTVDKARKISRNSLSGRSQAVQKKINGNKLIVGKQLSIDATKLLHDNLRKNSYPISNNIGIGILSYNRQASLERLINSIIKHTDLLKTTIFISDDNSTNQETIEYLNKLDKNHNLTIIRNHENVGVAGNSNRLLRCLSRFKYCIMLNDDVEVLQQGWDHFYPEAIKKTSIEHFQYRQIGIYGAQPGLLINKGSFHIRKVDEKPHGAVLAFTNNIINKCGYFNDRYGKYGLEHVDWSMKPSEFGLQEVGFFDVEGSDRYFKIHSDKTSVDDKNVYLDEARKVFSNRKKERIQIGKSYIAPEITYIIPFRNTSRDNSILSVVNNIRAQRFPIIHIIMVEQDQKTKIDLSKFQPVSYYLAEEHNDLLFNKSQAFNLGVSHTPSEKIIFHDADMLVLSNYTSSISDTLDTYSSCHLGGTVIYTSKQTMENINRTGVVNIDASCDRVVGYYEGGSLACTKKTYWSVGGFNEDFKGYGCFAPGNLVATDRGYIAIENIHSDDKLLTHAGNYKKQISRIREYSNSVLDIFISGRIPIKGVTPEHPFLVKQNNGDFVWTEARDIRFGDELGQTNLFADMSSSTSYTELETTNKLKSDFKTQFGLVYKIKTRIYKGLVYNFEVDDDHSYCVQGVIAHNCEDCDFYARLSQFSKWKEERKFDLLHLWHGRIDGWNNHHEENKKIEEQLNQIHINKRIELQRDQLKRLGYGEHLSE